MELENFPSMCWPWSHPGIAYGSYPARPVNDSCNAEERMGVGGGGLPIKEAEITELYSSLDLFDLGRVHHLASLGFFSLHYKNRG